MGDESDPDKSLRGLERERATESGDAVEGASIWRRLSDAFCRCGLHELGTVRSPRLSFEVRPSGSPDVCLAQAVGAIDADSCETIHDFFEGVLGRGGRWVVMDLARLKYINCTGLGSTVRYADTLRQQGGALIFINIPSKVQIVFEMLGLMAFFEQADSLEDALERINAALVEVDRPRLPDRHPPFLDPNEAIQEWEYFVLEGPGGEQRRSVLLRAGLWEHAPCAERPWRLTVSLPVMSPTPPALLPTPQEESAIEEFESELLTRLRRTNGARVVCRETEPESITWTFYAVENRGAWRSVVQSLPDDSPRLDRLHFESEQDPQWTGFYDLLHAGLPLERLLSEPGAAD